MSSELKVDTISEKTSAAGVTVDGVLIKDGLVDGKDVSTLGGVGILQAQSFGPIGGSGNQLERTAASYADVPNHTIAITPQVATSKIFVIMSVHTWGTDCSGSLKIVENSSGSYATVHETKMISGNDKGGMQHSLQGLIDHDTTSAFTIKLQGYSNADNSSNRFRITWYDATSTGHAFEIGGI